jgi:hypothetical protein
MTMRFSRAGAAIAFGIAMLVFARMAPAQSPAVENFDVSGLKGGLRAWTIRLEVIAHTSGDIKDAAKIQQDLVEYYSSKGDSTRARTAMAAQAAALQRLSGGGPTSPTVTPPTPSPQPTGPSVNPGDGGSTTSPPPTVPSANFVTNTEPTEDTGGTTIEARYYYMAGGVLHTWDFSADGTYLYTEVVSSGGFSGRSSERGSYTISGAVLEVRAKKKTDATTSTVTGGDRSTLTGDTGASHEVRRYKVRLIGPFGRDGMVLNGIQMKRKTW